MTSSKKIPRAQQEKAFSIFHLSRALDPYPHPNGNIGEDVKIVPLFKGKLPALTPEHALARAKEVFPQIQFSLAVGPYDVRHESTPTSLPSPARSPGPANPVRRNNPSLRPNRVY